MRRKREYQKFDETIQHPCDGFCWPKRRRDSTGHLLILAIGFVRIFSRCLDNQLYVKTAGVDTPYVAHFCYHERPTTEDRVPARGQSIVWEPNHPGWDQMLVDGVWFRTVYD